MESPAIARRASGFTLLEMLVAIALFATVSVMAYGGLAQMIRVKEGNDAASARLAELQMAWLLIQRDLLQAVPRPIRDENGEPEGAFSGDGSGTYALLFTRGGSTQQTGLLRSSLSRVGYRLQEGGLYRDLWAVLDRDVDSRPFQSPMVEGVTAMDLRFLTRDREWVTRWPAETGNQSLTLMPQAVEVKLSLEAWGEVSRIFPLNAMPEVIAPSSTSTSSAANQ